MICGYPHRTLPSSLEALGCSVEESPTLLSANSSLYMARDYKVSLLRSRVSWQSSDHALPGEADRRLFVTHAAAAASHRFLVAIMVCGFAATIFNTELCGGLAISGRDVAVTVAEPPVTDTFAERSMDVDIVESFAMARLSQRRTQKKIWSSATLATVYCYLAPSKGGSGCVPAANSLCLSH